MVQVILPVILMHSYDLIYDFRDETFSDPINDYINDYEIKIDILLMIMQFWYTT